MSIFIGILTVFEVIVCLLLSLLVLMQRPRQEGLGATFGSGMTDQMFGAQTTNVLQRGTVYLGVALFALTFLLAVLTSRMDAHKSGAKLVESADLKEKPAATAPALPAAANANKDATPAPAVTPAPAAKPAAEAAKPAEKKPADAKPADAKPAEVKPAPAAVKPAAAAPVPAPAAPAPATPAPVQK